MLIQRQMGKAVVSEIAAGSNGLTAPYPTNIGKCIHFGVSCITFFTQPESIIPKYACKSADLRSHHQINASGLVMVSGAKRRQVSQMPPNIRSATATTTTQNQPWRRIRPRLMMIA